jgi:hypothetical protein
MKYVESGVGFSDDSVVTGGPRLLPRQIFVIAWQHKTVLGGLDQ